jgi:hypothetical protein
MEEIWKDVIGYEGIYMVSSLGRMKSNERVIERKKVGIYVQPETFIAGCEYHGYLKTSLRKDGSKKDKFIHCLVAEAFLGIKPEGMEVCHGDGDRKNNRIENLRYGTRADNVRDAIKHGTHFTPFASKGVERSYSKLNDEIVRYIRTSSETTYGLAKRFNVSKWAISNVRNNISWVHVQ